MATRKVHEAGAKVEGNHYLSPPCKGRDERRGRAVVKAAERARLTGERGGVNILLIVGGVSLEDGVLSMRERLLERDEERRPLRD